MNITNADDPAQPFSLMDFQPASGEQVVRHQYMGLSKREHIATVIMAGLCSHSSWEEGYGDTARYAVNYADELIKKLNQQIVTESVNDSPASEKESV